jgi:thymidylate synthase (FAD)
MLKKYGKVELVSHEGDEELISLIAGVSRNSGTGPGVKKLLRWGHFSPFEFASMTFFIECPVFVARQLMRHRTASYMEASLRYCEGEPEFFVREVGNRTDITNTRFETAYDKAYQSYKELLESGVSKEQARAVLPVGMYTKFFVKYDMRNMIEMLKQRLSKHAQRETRWYAGEMLTEVQSCFPTIADYIKKEIE